MIKFFRKIRRKLLQGGKFKRYLIYAVGEILLVVIGILIALQINNWNEEQKNHKADKEKYAAMILDLERDLERQMRLYWSVGWSKALAYELAEKPMNDTTFVERFSYNYLIYTLDYYSYVKENHKHLTGEITDKKINDKLAQYLYYQYGVDQGLSAFNDLVQEMRAYFSENGILDLEVATSFEGAYTRDSTIQVVNEAKLRAQIDDDLLRGHIVLQKTLSQRIREKMFGLMKANNELQVLLASYINQPRGNDLGVVGSALPDGPDHFVAFKQTSDQENTWEVLLDLEDGEIRFQKELDPWRFNWGRNGFQQGDLEPVGADIPVKKGRYLIKVDLNELSYSLSEDGK